MMGETVHGILGYGLSQAELLEYCAFFHLFPALANH